MSNNNEKQEQPIEPCGCDTPCEATIEDLRKQAIDYIVDNYPLDGTVGGFIVNAIEEYLPRSYDGHTYPHAKRELEMGGFLKKGEDTMYDGML